MFYDLITCLYQHDVPRAFVSTHTNATNNIYEINTRYGRAKVMAECVCWHSFVPLHARLVEKVQ